MIRLLAFLWSGCWHVWEQDERSRLTVIGLGDSKSTGYRVYAHCKHCGLPKKWDLA